MDKLSTNNNQKTKELLEIKEKNNWSLIINAPNAILNDLADGPLIGAKFEL